MCHSPLVCQCLLLLSLSLRNRVAVRRKGACAECPCHARRQRRPGATGRGTPRPVFLFILTSSARLPGSSPPYLLTFSLGFASPSTIPIDHCTISSHIFRISGRSQTSCACPS